MKTIGHWIEWTPVGIEVVAVAVIAAAVVSLASGRGARPIPAWYYRYFFAPQTRGDRILYNP